MPARPILRFFHMYVLRRGFLDGRRGLLFCALIAMYDAMIEAKIAERKLVAAEVAVDASPVLPTSARARHDPRPSAFPIDTPGDRDEEHLRDAA
jgi:hypothetical protein